MLEDADISYIAARYSLLSGGEEGDGVCSERKGGQGGRFGGGQEVIGECSDPPTSGEQHPSGAASSSSSRRQNTVQASLPNTVSGGIALLPGSTTSGESTGAAELAGFGRGASSQNTLIGANTTQQTDRVSSTHTGTSINEYFQKLHKTNPEFPWAIPF